MLPLAYTYSIPLIGILSLLGMWLRTQWVMEQDAGREEMQQISDRIARGASAFLKAEYRIMAAFVIVVSLLLLAMSYYSPHTHYLMVVAYLVGALFSALAGYAGMYVATRANVRTTEAARTSLSRAFLISFAGGSVMAMGVVGLALLGMGIIFGVAYAYLATEEALPIPQLRMVVEIMTGFALGAESIALFARVAGGIYTKAADVGADIVGKTEANIPEDDPRNPATIADNVGDNVGDVAGMGADLFGSFVSTILAAMVLGCAAYQREDPSSLWFTILPLIIAAIGTVVSLLVMLVTYLPEGKKNVQAVLNKANMVALLLTAICGYLFIHYLLPPSFTLMGATFTTWQLSHTLAIGLATGAIVSAISEYYTSDAYPPVRQIIAQSMTGPATNLIAGLSVGMQSTAAPVLVFGISIMASFHLAGFYGVAMAAVGMMSTTAMQLAIDAFGPIADNAGGIAEMSGLPAKVRERTDILDTVGNTTAATGKGFAIASAALTSVGLFAAYIHTIPGCTIRLYEAPVLAGLLLGAMIPVLFSSLAMGAVGKAATQMVEEVRRQFREIEGLLEGKATPDYDRCVAIATQASLREMRLPGVLTLVVPLLVGYFLGAEVLGAYVAGVTTSGVLMAFFQCNAGGAWDNAKKAFEKGVKVGDETLYKGCDAHKAAVVGDTVGDPFKDTSGPAMNILIKLTAILALMMAPYLAG